MIDCEIWAASGDFASFDARFAVLPRVGEQVVISIGEAPSEIFWVRRVVHVQLDEHGNNSRPGVKLWVEKA